ncbi:tyrosine-type recombinase/integrase [Pseudonocardia kongjuensis]|uniref:tyrosine-type recombinase/integrase n=1 Tax=Pseudonocardia kongjuensis TaxID=102227 RepID=UPI0031DA8A62
MSVLLRSLAAHDPSTDGLIFHTAEGRPLLQESVGRQVFGTGVRRAGLPVGTTSHDLRRHYASVLLAAGESVLAVAERLGHEDATLVLTTYGHLMPNSEDRTRKAIDGAWSALPGGRLPRLPPPRCCPDDLSSRIPAGRCRGAARFRQFPWHH